MSLRWCLQIALAAKKWCFLFPRKESCYSPASVASLATVLALPCCWAGAGESAQLIAAEPVQRPHADVLHVSSMNAHPEPCPFCPATANLQGARQQTLPGEKERFYSGSAHVWLSPRVLQETSPSPSWGVPCAIPTALPHSGVWAITAERTPLRGMRFLALFLTLQVSNEHEEVGNCIRTQQPIFRSDVSLCSFRLSARFVSAEVSKVPSEMQREREG